MAGLHPFNKTWATMAAYANPVGWYYALKAETASKECHEGCENWPSTAILCH